MKKIKIYFILLALAHLFVLAVLYYKFGINTLNEGNKYLTRAFLFANGDFVNATQYQTFYIAYVSYLALLLFLKLPIPIIFLCTYLLSIFSYYKFFQLIKSSLGETTAIIWITLVTLSPLIQFWQLNLFSETFFIAVSLLFSYFTLYPSIRYRIIKAGLLACIVVFSRPSGIFTVLILLFYKLYKDGVFSKERVFSYSILTMFILFIGVFFIFQLPYFDFSLFISNGSIYYGFPSWQNPHLPPGNYTLWDCYKFLYEEKGLSTIFFLFIKKLDSFFVTTRPYYSSFHNFINFSHYLLYPFALIAVYFLYKKRSIGLGILFGFITIIGLNALMIAIIFNEWSERHTLHVFPYIMLLASYSLNSLYHSFKIYKKPNPLVRLLEFPKK